MQLGMGALFGLSMIAFANTTAFTLSLFTVGVVGFAGNASTGLNSALLMLRTEEAFYGRVMSIYMMNWSLMTLFTLPLGILVDRYGAPLVISAAALGIVAFMGATALLAPNIREGRHHQQVAPVENAPTPVEESA